MKKTFRSVLAAAAAVLIAGGAAQAAVKVGVVAPKGELVAKTQWTPFGAYLSKTLGDKVEIVPLAVAKGVDAAAAKTIDFIVANPTQTLILKAKHGATPLASLNKKSGKQFAGAIIAKKGKGIANAADLKGKKVMSLKKNQAAGAYIFQAYHLLEAGVDPEKDLASLKEGKKQQDLVLAVRAGLADAAFVRSGMLEGMAKSGKVKMDDFVVVDKKSGDGLAPLHTTVLYPNWYLSAVNGADAGVSAKVKAAALKLPAGDPAADKAGLKGFIEPLDLAPLEKAMKALKAPPFN
jgi:ABC-type phosphate/phosphonate transport system substrate-binding protein